MTAGSDAAHALPPPDDSIWPVLFPDVGLGRPDVWRTWADRYCHHEFNILGSGWVRVHYGMQAPGFEGYNYSNSAVTWDHVREQLPEQHRSVCDRCHVLARRLVRGYVPIDWHIDIKSGYRFPLEHHSRLQYGVVAGVDAKVPSDLSRGYHLVVLAQAWRATGDERYRREIMVQILDWLAANPYGYGAGWRACMNVAIRAANWVSALALTGAGMGASDEAEFGDIVRASLREHRAYIAANLEFPEGAFHPNHYIANLAGLLVISAFCRSWDEEATAWERIAGRELGKELDTQVYPDGVDFEGASAYHAFVLEMVSYSLILAARAYGATSAAACREHIQQMLGGKRLEILHRMFAALKSLIQPNGLLTVIGDNDSGRFLVLETPGADGRDWRHLTWVGAELFNDAGLLAGSVAGDHAGAADALFGGHSVQPSKKSLISAAYRDAGFYILRDDRHYMFINCGPIGTGGLGGHSHNDKLALTLCIGDNEVLVDAGVYVYTADVAYRNLYRSVSVHNTVAVAGEEQNRFLEASPWWGCHDDTQCRCLVWQTGGRVEEFAGEHVGYMRLAAPVRHNRRIEWHKDCNKVVITDELLAAALGPGTIAVCTFMLHPACRLVENAHGKASIQCGSYLVTMTASASVWHLEEGLYSPNYGVKERTLLLQSRFDSKMRHQTTLSW